VHPEVVLGGTLQVGHADMVRLRRGEIKAGTPKS